MKRSSPALRRPARALLTVEPLEDRRVLSFGLGSLTSAVTPLVSLQLPSLVAPVIVTTQPTVVTPNTGTGSVGVVNTPVNNPTPALSTQLSSIVNSLLSTVAPIVASLPTSNVSLSTTPLNSLSTLTSSIAPVLNSLTSTLNTVTGSLTQPLSGVLSTVTNVVPVLSTVTNLVNPLVNNLTSALVGNGTSGSGLLGGLVSTVSPLLSNLGIGVGLNTGSGALSVNLPLLSVSVSLPSTPLPVSATIGVDTGSTSGGSTAVSGTIGVNVGGDSGSQVGGGGSVTITVGSDGGGQTPPPIDGGQTSTSTVGSGDGTHLLGPIATELALVSPNAAGDPAHSALNGGPLVVPVPGAHAALDIFFTSQADEPIGPNGMFEEQPDVLAPKALGITLLTQPGTLDGTVGSDSALPAASVATPASALVVGPTGAAVPTSKEQAEALSLAAAEGNRLADAGALNLVSLEQEVQQFLNQLNNLHHDLSDMLATFGLSPWMFGMAVAAVVGMEGRRRFRKRKASLAQALAGNDAALPWVLQCEHMLNAESA